MDEATIRDLALATGHTAELTPEQVREIERRIQADHVDKVLDGNRS